MSFPDLETLWYEDDPNGLRCFTCKQAFGSDALVRTFRLRAADESKSRDGFTEASKIISEPSGGGIAIYDRHLQCLISNEINFVGISHVWSLSVSHEQAQGRHSPQDDEVRRLALSQPMGIARSVAQSLGGDTEIWHDHISVPQWSPQLKKLILQSIHKIFGSAVMTIVHLDDVPPAMIEKFLAGSSIEERSEGMIGICNAKWYSRVWTAMEYVRSPNIRVMDSESQIHGEVSAFVFQDSLGPFWEEVLVKTTNDVHELEHRLGIGNNVMPWNLGPLIECRDRDRRNFGLAFALLCRRSCHSRDDFLYALHGIVTGSSVSELEGDWDERYIGIAKLCLERGDYTPLIVTPELTQGVDVRNMPANNVNEGFHDVYAYSLGCATSSPLYHSDFCWEGPNEIFLKTQHVGAVTRCELYADIFWDYLAAACVETTGPEVQAFLDAYGIRLFCETKENMMESLSIGDRHQMLQDTLIVLSKLKLENGIGWPADTPFTISDLLEALGLSNKSPSRTADRIAWVRTKGSVLHLNWRQYLLWVTCPTCSKATIFRAGLYVEPEETRDAIVCRIPGLEYEFSLKDGVCLIVKGDGRIIGRMIWATPNCECDGLQMVKLQLPYLPRPRAREEFLRQLGRP